MGVGHVDAVPGWAGCDGEQAAVVECWCASGKRDRRLLSGPGVLERDEADEPSEHGVSECDDAWVEYGADVLLRWRSHRPHGVRGYHMGV